jgi:hypothetical protein
LQCNRCCFARECVSTVPDALYHQGYLSTEGGKNRLSLEEEFEYSIASYGGVWRSDSVLCMRPAIIIAITAIIIAINIITPLNKILAMAAKII